MIDVAAIVATMGRADLDRHMKTLAAREAKYNFGRLIDTARAEPVVIEKHGRPVVVVVAVEEFERLRELSAPETIQSRKQKSKRRP